MSSPLLFRIVGFDFAAVQNLVAAVQIHLVAVAVGYTAAAALVVADIAVGYLPADQCEHNQALHLKFQYLTADHFDHQKMHFSGRHA